VAVSSGLERFGGRLRGPFWPIIGTLAFLLLGFVWAYSTPAGSATDDDFHLPSIWCAWGPSDTCQPGPEAGSVLVPQRVAQSNCHVFGIVEDAGCVLSLTNDLVPTLRINDGHNPPLFYWMMRTLVGENVYQSVVLMRFLNVLIAAAIICLAAVVSRRRERVALLLGWTVLLVPVGLYFIASTNPSSWVIIGVGTFWAFLLAALRRGLGNWRGNTALIGALVSAAIALGSRLDSVIPLGLSIVVVVILSQREVATFVRRHRAASIGAAAVAVGALALAWVIGLGTRVQVALANLYVPPGDAVRDQPNAVVKALAELPHFLTSLVGAQRPYWVQREGMLDHTSAGYSTPAYFYGVSSMEYQLPAAIGAILIAVVGAVILLGFTDRNRRKLIAFAVAALGLVGAILLARASAGFVQWSNFFAFNIQPRYFYPYAIVIVGISLLVSRRLRPFVNGTQAAFIGLGLFIAQAIALRAILARYIYGIDHSWTQLDGSYGWWWPSGPSPDTVWLIGCGAAAVLYSVILFWVSRPPATNPSRQAVIAPSKAESHAP
jgi:hypothetical protein